MSNPDPFARPVWRAPVYQTPGGLMLLVQAIRGLIALVRFLARHPVLAGTLAIGFCCWRLLGWPS